MEIPKYDVVVVGGGAAGLSAALVLGRARRRVAVIDAGAPRNAPAAHMQGFLSRDGMSPADLLTVGRGEVTGYGVELVEDQVVAIEPGFVVSLASGPVLKARRILVATGVRDERDHRAAIPSPATWARTRRDGSRSVGGGSRPAWPTIRSPRGQTRSRRVVAGIEPATPEASRAGRLPAMPAPAAEAPAGILNDPTYPGNGRWPATAPDRSPRQGRDPARV